MTYHLRRLRLHGMIERISTSDRYRLTDLGPRTAWLFTRTYSRILRPGIGTILPEVSASTRPLRRSFDQLDRAVKSWIEEGKIGSLKLDSFTSSCQLQDLTSSAYGNRIGTRPTRSWNGPPGFAETMGIVRSVVLGIVYIGSSLGGADFRSTRGAADCRQATRGFFFLIMLICSVVGARPQFVKLAVICRALAGRHASESWDHKIVHTGQHYDPALSDIFFEELAIPQPDHHLEVGSGSHGPQTGAMLERLEPVLVKEKPDCVLLYGDTNSTLAGALVAAKLGLTSAHVESGLRSYRRAMPEEINRVVADHVCDLLLCPTALAINNLRSEGLERRAVLTGDVMYDASIAYRERAEKRGGRLAEAWKAGEFALATVHRAENTDNVDCLRDIVRALDRISRTDVPVVWPVHPRTKKRLSEIGLSAESVRMIAPVSYLDMLLLESRARFILTDSGGVQKEAYFFQVPCITLRDETEWQETLANGCNVLTGACEEKILAAADDVTSAGPWTAVYGDGNAGNAILDAVQNRVAG